MADWDEPEKSGDADDDDDDTGLVGGGGPAATIDELPGPDDEDAHRADTDHREL
jgi:hypothetical protein